MAHSRSLLRVALVMSAALSGGILLLEPIGSANDPPPFRTDSFMTLNTRGVRQ